MMLFLGAGGPFVLSLPELPPSSSVSGLLLLLLLVLEELDLRSTVAENVDMFGPGPGEITLHICFVPKK